MYIYVYIYIYICTFWEDDVLGKNNVTGHCSANTRWEFPM